MLKILIGPKGTGKTKVFINMVNEALETEKGNVVCITKGDRHIFDISSGVRLVDVTDFDITNINCFYGLICGMISQNYDITHIFIDSITKIINVSAEDFDEIIPELINLGNKFSVKFTVAISAPNGKEYTNINNYTVKI